MSEQRFSGSCLCGGVRYEISGEVQAFFHCHCGRCRKATGTGHASNVIVRYTSQTWIAGDDLRRRFNLPGAKRFHTVFCADCGGPLPRIAEDRQVAVIPAGSLDNDVDLQPTGRIFQDSRAAWSCHGDGLQQWDQYP